MCVCNRLSEDENVFTRLIERYAVELPERLTLESKEDFIYLSDLETYELYLISMENPSELHAEWRDYKGKKCYEMLQQRTSPCPFCTNHLLERDIDYIWNFHNEMVGADYILKDRLVDWQGKTVRMEVVINVSDTRRIDKVLRRSLAAQNILTGCLRRLFQTNALAEGCTGVLQKLAPFFGAESGYVQCYGAQAVLAQWEAGESIVYQNAITAPSAAALAAWGERLMRGQQLVIKNTDALRLSDPIAWEALRGDCSRSLCATPIYLGEQLTGFIFLRNISKNWTEIPVLVMLAGFLSMMLQKHALEEERLRLLYHDDTAQCPNFLGFRKEALEILAANPWRQYALWYCDIKSFKYINDIFGYTVGDELLRHWAQILHDTLREGETFGRISGDNFVSLRWYEDRDVLPERFARMATTLAAFAPTAAQKYRVDMVAGVFLIGDAERKLSLDEMLNRANMAQKSVKELPGSRFAFYDEALRRQILQDLQMESEMQDALRNGDFVLHLQPQVALVSEGLPLRAEALVRWKRADGVLLPPGDFIELFEKDGLIVDLDRYVFEKACGLQRDWMQSDKPALCLAVNVSRISMLQTNFVADYCRIKQAYGIPDGLLELEFTETIVVSDYDRFRDVVLQLKAHGFLCAVDDFGSCQSSLNLLKNLPLDVLKMDRLFFCADDAPERGMAVVECVLRLAQALEMHTVAEGIESMPLVESLRALGCDCIQGFVFAHPMSAERFFALPASDLAFFAGGGG